MSIHTVAHRTAIAISKNLDPLLVADLVSARPTRPLLTVTGNGPINQFDVINNNKLLSPILEELPNRVPTLPFLTDMLMYLDLQYNKVLLKVPPNTKAEYENSVKMIA